MIVKLQRNKVFDSLKFYKSTSVLNPKSNLYLIKPGTFLFFFTIIYRFALDISYKYYVSIEHYSEGYFYTLNEVKFFESWLVLLSIFIVNPVVLRRPSAFILCIAYFLFIVPFGVYYSLADLDRTTYYLVVFQYLIMLWVCTGKVIKIGGVAGGKLYAKYIALVFLTLATIWMIYIVGLSKFNLDIYAVYELRSSTGDQLSAGAMGYIIPWVTNVFGIVLLVLGLEQRKPVVVFISFILFVLWFGLTGYKSVLIYPFAIVFIYFFARSIHALYIIPLLLSTVLSISLFAYYHFDDSMLGIFIVRRVFFVPSNLTFNYFDFFTANPFVIWSNSFLSIFLRYPYGDLGTASVVGNYINDLYTLNDPDLWANNSFFSTGYMHAGIIGMLCYGVIAGYVLKTIDSISASGVPVSICLALSFVPLFNLFLSSDLFTALLTHGLGICLLMLYLFIPKNPKKVNV